MIEIALSTFAGIVLGLVFSLLKLPLPAPPVFAGIMGIVGIYLGGLIYQYGIQIIKNLIGG